MIRIGLFIAFATGIMGTFAKILALSLSLSIASWSLERRFISNGKFVFPFPLAVVPVLSSLLESHPFVVIGDMFKPTFRAMDAGACFEFSAGN